MPMTSALLWWMDNHMEKMFEVVFSGQVRNGSVACVCFSLWWAWCFSWSAGEDLTELWMLCKGEKGCMCQIYCPWQTSQDPLGQFLHDINYTNLLPESQLAAKYCYKRVNKKKMVSLNVLNLENKRHPQNKLKNRKTPVSSKASTCAGKPEKWCANFFIRVHMELQVQRITACLWALFTVENVQQGAALSRV